MDLTQIRYFLALAKSLNFTRAAEACNVTQPALTKSIQRLEEELGGLLLLRERSHTQLTDLGRAMHPLLQQTFDAANAARLGALQFAQQDVVRLRIGIGTWVAPQTITPLIRPLCRRFPTLELTVRQGGAEALNAWLIASEIDVILTADAAALTERARSWAIFQDRVVALFPDGHKLAQHAPLEAETLDGEAMVGWLEPEGVQARAHKELEIFCPSGPAIRHRGSTEEHVRSLVRAGLGVALSTERHGAPPDVIARPLDPPKSLAVHVAAIAGRQASTATDAFIRLARAREWNS